MTSAIFSPSGGSVGLGFAIPAETVTSVISQLERHGRVQRGYLGISAQAMTPLLAKAIGLPAAGGLRTAAGPRVDSAAMVTSVDAAGPASNALAVGDVLLKIGPSVVTFKGLNKITARLKPQSIAVATVLRDGTIQTVGLTIGELPEPPVNPKLSGGQDTWVPSLRLGVAETTPDIRRSIKAGGEPSGVIVTQLRPSGAGALAGLKVGDLLTHVSTHQIVTVGDIEKVAKPTPDAPLLVRVVRDGTPSFLAITGESELQFP